jgi:pimeloyl-ACP methyl ester carboxylesterase
MPSKITAANAILVACAAHVFLQIVDGFFKPALIGTLPMPILCYGGAKGRGRGSLALESWQRVADKVRGGVVEDAGHWIPEEKPEWATQEILKFFGEER